MPWNLILLILGAALIAMASPGASTLAIAGVATKSGRKAVLIFTAGIWTGSVIWSMSIAFGLAAVLALHPWVLEVFKIFGTLYLLFLSYKCLVSAMQSNSTLHLKGKNLSKHKAYFAGVAIHLSNPKVSLFYISLYSLLPHDISQGTLLLIVALLAMQGGLVFFGYSLLFSTKAFVDLYLRMSRVFNYTMALLFFLVALKLLIS